MNFLYFCLLMIGASVMVTAHHGHHRNRGYHGYRRFKGSKTCEAYERKIITLKKGIRALVNQLQEKNNVCPSEWMLHKSSCYRIFQSSTKRWHDAQAHCRTLRSNLAVIESCTENDFLRQQLKRLETKPHQVWIGCSDAAQEGKWKWVTPAIPFVFTAWGSGEPNSFRGTNEDCCTMNFDMDYHWNDAGCGGTFGFICEMNMGCLQDNNVGGNQN